MGLPQFPAFHKLSLSLREAVEQHVHRYTPYSDFNFSSMWAWDLDNKIEVCQLNGNLAVQFADYNTNEKFYSFLGKNNVEDSASQLISLAIHKKITPTLGLIPEENFSDTPVTQLEKFVVSEDKDNFDYILSLDGLADMEGSTYHKKRNLVRRFLQAYQNHSVVVLPQNDPKVTKQIVDLFYVWESQRNKQRIETENELRAIERILSTNHVKQVILGIYVKDQLVSFSVSDKENDYAITHFEKSNNEYYGVSTYIKKVTAIEMRRRGCKFLNYEQDLGIPGLRTSKELLHPIAYLKKYSIATKA